MPVIIIYLWWLFWLVLSLSTLTGIYLPSINTYIIIIIGLFSFGVSYFLSVYSKSKTISFKKNFENPDFKFKSILIVFIPFVLFAASKSLSYLIKGDLSYYRQLIFGIDDEYFILGEVALTFYTLIVKPFFISLYTYSVVIYFKYKYKLFIAISLIFFFIDTIMFLGRFNLLYILLIPLLYISIYKYRSLLKVLRKMVSIKSIKYIIIVAISFYLISTFRSGDNIKYIGNTIVKYHTVSFTILDLEINDNNSRLNDYLSLGRASSGNLEKFSVFILQQFGIDVHSIPGRNGGYLREYRIVGNSSNGSPIYSNAFATMFYSMYMDGRIIGILFISSLLGFLLGRNYRYSFKYNNDKSVVLVILLSFYMIIGIYMPVLDGHVFMNYIFIRYIL